MKIFLIAYGGGHIAMLAPVAFKLQECGYQTVILALTTAQKYLESWNLPYIGFKDLPGAKSSLVQKWGSFLLDQLPAAGVVNKNESLSYLGLSYSDLIEQHGKIEAEKLYKEKGRQAFLPVQTLKKALEIIKPDVVVATNSPRAERAAIYAASQLNIPSLCLVDMFAFQEVEWIGQPNYASRVCVLNNAVRDMFLACGRNEEEVVVTGNPAFDRLTTSEAMSSGVQLKQKRRWTDGVITILWASQVELAKHPINGKIGDTELPRKIEAKLREFVSQNPQFRLVVRYHPSEQVQFVSAERIEFSPVSEDLVALLHAVDVVVVTASTVGLEASLAGKVVISVDCSVISEDVPYSKMGISYGISSPSNLPTIITQLYKEEVIKTPLSYPELNELLSRAPRNLTSSTATEKVVGVIKSLIN